MSINSAARSVRARQSQADQATSRFASSDAERDSVLGKLTAFVPAEIITAWGAILAVISPTKDSERWIIFAAGLGVLVAVLLLDVAIKDKLEREKDPKAQPTSRGRKAKTCLIVGSSFSVWALASPGTPLSTSGARVAFGVAVVLTLLVNRVATFWEIAPSD